jgi:S-formylglutathione hydrolase
VRRQRYEDYVVQDVLAWVDATYRTRQGRGARGVGGLSMGGLGALSLAMRHPDVFSVAVSHSGAVSLLYAGPHPFAPGRVVQLSDLAAWGGGGEVRVPGMPDWVRRIYGPDLAGWRAHDPATLAASLRDGRLALSFDAGAEDWLGYDDEALYLAEVLTAAGVSHEVTIVPGGDHDDRYFETRVDDALAFFAAHLSGVQ